MRASWDVDSAQGIVGSIPRLPSLSTRDTGAMSHELSPANAEAEIARQVAEALERHWKRFGEGEQGFSYPNIVALTVPVLQRAAREFWHEHPSLWPTFSVSGTGVSARFMRIRRR